MKSVFLFLLLAVAALASPHAMVVARKNVSEGGGGGSVTLTYHNKVEGTDVTAFDETGAAIGTASSDRVVWVAMVGRFNSATPTATMTIGGVSATQQAYLDGAFCTVWIFSAAVPTGTTADIDTTVSTYGTDVWCGMGWWTTTGASATAYDTVTGTGGASTIDTIANGALIGIAGTTDDANPGIYTWTGLSNERWDERFGVEADGASGADESGTSTATGASVGPDSHANQAWAVVAIQPSS